MPAAITAARQARRAPRTHGRSDAATPPVLALDLGATQIRSAIVLADGSLRARQSARTPVAAGPDAVIHACEATLRATLEEHRADGGAKPEALGISAPGPLDSARGVLLEPPNFGSEFRGLPLGPRLAASLGLPLRIDLDTRVALLAERAFGAAAGVDNVVYLTVSTGIGGAIMSEGRLMTGPDGVAGELGHLVVDMDGPLCGCGLPGHLERLSSGSGMARSAREALERGEHASELARLAAEIDPAPLEAVHVWQAAEAGDLVARVIVDRAIRAFAAAVVSIVDVFNPELVVVGGGVAEAWGDRLLAPAREVLARSGYRVAAGRARLVPARLGGDVGLIGALPLVRLAGLTTVAAVQPERINEPS
ncbi:MAG: glucokinase [Chloroflexota bacterium]|jgi:glucokinase|nr:glucokinase [Chloroflexota bacterium]